MADHLSKTKIIEDKGNYADIVKQIEELCGSKGIMCESIEYKKLAKSADCEASTDVISCCMDNEKCIQKESDKATEKLQALQPSFTRFSTKKSESGDIQFTGVKDVKVCRIGSSFHGYNDLSDLKDWVLKTTDSDKLECGLVNTTSMYHNEQTNIPFSLENVDASSFRVMSVDFSSLGDVSSSGDIMRGKEVYELKFKKKKCKDDSWLSGTGAELCPIIKSRMDMGFHTKEQVCETELWGGSKSKCKGLCQDLGYDIVC